MRVSEFFLGCRARDNVETLPQVDLTLCGPGPISGGRRRSMCGQRSTALFPPSCFTIWFFFGPRDLTTDHHHRSGPGPRARSQGPVPPARILTTSRSGTMAHCGGPPFPKCFLRNLRSLKFQENSLILRIRPKSPDPPDRIPRIPTIPKILKIVKIPVGDSQDSGDV